MGSTLAIDGLVSGLDTTSLINSLMQVEAVPQTLLKNKVSETQAFVTALQSLNTKVASLADVAAKAAKPAALDLYSATSSAPAVSATASSSAQPGQLDITVDKLAYAQKTVSDAMTAWPVSPPVLTVQGSDGTLHEITANSTSLDDMVTAVKASGVGITATKVSIGGGNYRLQFASNTVGAAGAFTLYEGSGTATPLATTAIRAAQDASVTLWAGTAAAQSVTSTTNTFTDLLPGVSITVSALAADPVSITVKRDDNAISKSAGDLVAALNGIFSDIANKSAVTTSTDSTGTTSVKGGVFTSDSTVRDVDQRLLSAATLPVNGSHSPSEYGISINKSGSIDFDADRFKSALAADPVATKAALQEIASRVSGAASSISDKYDGSLSLVITGQQAEVKDLGAQVDDWDRRLTTRRSTLEATYAALEVQLSKLNSQQTYLSSQLAGLSTSNG